MVGGEENGSRRHNWHLIASISLNLILTALMLLEYLSIVARGPEEARRAAAIRILSAKTADSLSALGYSQDAYFKEMESRLDTDDDLQKEFLLRLCDEN